MENGCDGVALGSEVVFEVSIGLKGCLKNTEEYGFVNVTIIFYVFSG